jgi:hypothetical protein
MLCNNGNRCSPRLTKTKTKLTAKCERKERGEKVTPITRRLQQQPFLVSESWATGSLVIVAVVAQSVCTERMNKQKKKLHPRKHEKNRDRYAHCAMCYT